MHSARPNLLWVTIHALGQAYTFLQLAKDCIRKIMSCGDMHVQKAHIEEEDVSFLHEAGMKVKRCFSSDSSVPSFASLMESASARVNTCAGAGVNELL